MQPLPLPPRAVTGGPGAHVWIGRVFTLPHLLVGVGLLGGSVFALLAPVLATEVDGVVTDGRSTTSKGHTTDFAQVAYTLPSGARDTAWVTLPAGMKSQVFAPDGAPLPNAHLAIKVFGAGSAKEAWLVGESAFLWPVVPFALFWNAIMFGVLHQLWLVPRRKRRLVVEGTALVGRVESKRSWSGKSMHYCVKYACTDELGQTVQREAEGTDRAKWEKLVEGGTVTVLTDGKHFEVLELSDYSIKGEGV